MTIYPQREQFRTAYGAVAAAPKASPLPICCDGRARLGRREHGNRRMGMVGENTASVGFGAYRAKTGRNQPGRSNSCLPQRLGGGPW